MSYVESIEEVGLSSKEKALKCFRGRNFHPIITKLAIHVGLIKLQIEFGDGLYCVNRRGRTFLKRNFSVVPRGQNFNSIFIKLGKMVETIKIIDQSVNNEACGVNLSRRIE